MHGFYRIITLIYIIRIAEGKILNTNIEILNNVLIKKLGDQCLVIRINNRCYLRMLPLLTFSN